MARSKQEIEDQVALSFDRDFSGMSYSEGVRAALDWMTGDTDEEPMSE
jgi:hypothetical protein